MIIAELRSLRWDDLFLFALLDPRALFRQIDRKEPRSFALGFIVPGMVTMSIIIAMALLGRETSFFFYKVTYGWILGFLAVSVLIVVWAALMDMAAQIFGYRGNIRDIITQVNFSIFPCVFILPLVYVFRILNYAVFRSYNSAPIFFFVLFFTGLGAWSLYNAVEGISEMHSAGSGKSTVICLFPFLLLGTVSFFMLVLAIVCGVGYIAG
jgi:hypothetical protein